MRFLVNIVNNACRHLLCEFNDRALEGRYGKYALSSRIEVARVAEVLEARRPRGLA